MTAAVQQPDGSVAHRDEAGRVAVTVAQEVWSQWEADHERRRVLGRRGDGELEDRPLDVLLSALRSRIADAYRCDIQPDTWRAVCPACPSKRRTEDRMAGRWPLLLIERGIGDEVQINCAHGCTEAVVVDALGHMDRREAA